MVGQEYKKRKPRDEIGQFTSIEIEKRKLMVKMIIFFLFLIALITLSIRTFMAIAKWSEFNYIETHKPITITFAKPITIEQREQQKVLSPFVVDDGVEMTPEEIIARSNNPVILRGVYMLESTKGQNDGCKEDGLINGFGFRQNSSEFRCYRDFSSVVSKVDNWFSTRLSENNNNVAEALCFYNKGIANLNSCDYSQNFLMVLGDALKD